MKKYSKKFGEILDRAVLTVSLNTRYKKLAIIDELVNSVGYSRSTYYNWSNGKIPKQETVWALARRLFKREGLNCKMLKDFLTSVDLDPTDLVAELCPTQSSLSLLDLDPNEDDPSISQPPNLPPFVPGIPLQHPCQFFGRETILEEIFRLWRQDALYSGTFIGDKRSGKTSLLEYIRAITTTPPYELRSGQRTNWLSLDKHIHWVFVDFQDPSMRRQKSLLPYLLHKLNLPIPKSCTHINFNRIVGEQLQEPTVILVDEFDKGLTAKDTELDQDFWEGMRALLRKTKFQLAFLIAAMTRPDKLAPHQGITSPFFNYLRFLNRGQKLGPFSEAEALALINSSPIPFLEADIAWILANNPDRWPHPLQICCYHRYNALEKGDTSEIWKEDALAEMNGFEDSEE